jgi:hypothetical protein
MKKAMHRNSSISAMDMIRLAFAVGTLIVVFVVSAAAERKAKERDDAARDNLERQITQVYQVLQLTISRTESCAVETDKSGNVLWMNKKAKDTLRLCKGHNVTSCMTEDGAHEHEIGFAKAMRYARSDAKPLSVIPECIAITKDGSEIRVSVETWRTPNGAMAFVTPLGERQDRYTNVDETPAE